MNHTIKILNKYIIKELSIPFLYSFLILLFVLISNFLLKSLDKFLGKGLGIGLLFEFLFLNLGWILSLAIPMSVLIASLMAYGRMASDNEMIALKATGFSIYKILLPALIVGFILTILMTYYNNEVLPEMNHKARILSSSISKKRPDLEIESGFFLNQIPDYSIYIKEKKGNTFYDIKIFGTSNTTSKRTITANSGTFESVYDGIIMHLENGFIDERGDNIDDYTKIKFEKYDIALEVSNLNLNRKNTRVRGDREMDYAMINQKLLYFINKIEKINYRIKNRIDNNFKTIKFDKNSEKILVNIDKYIKELNSKNDTSEELKKTIRKASNIKQGILNDLSIIKSYKKSYNKYLVELHKKFSIAFASITFILVGAPLGIMIKKGNVFISASLSIIFFIIFWALLISGEQFADRALVEPWIAMWFPNILMGLVGLLLCSLVSKDKQII